VEWSPSRRLSRSLLGNFLTYFWSQPKPALTIDDLHAPVQLSPPRGHGAGRDEPTAGTVGPTAAALVRGPAIGLLACCVHQLYFVICVSVLANFSKSERPVFYLVYVMPVVLSNFGLAFGAVQLLRVRSLGWAWAAALLACLPCTPAFFVSLPVAVWTMRTLEKSAVRAAFGRK
jgi:hypothetical protein